MGRKKKQKKEVSIAYPPVTTRKWIPPDLRKKKKKPKPPPYPPHLTQQLTVSSLLKVWHDYKIVNDCAVLLGDISMFHHRFTFVTNGFQSHCICIICALYSKMCPSYHWCSKTIDEIVLLGDRYYQRNRRIMKIDPVIPIEQLNKDLFIHQHKITICLKGEKYQGMITKEPDSNGEDFVFNILKKFFECNSCGVLFTESNPKRFFTIWKFGKGYFLFDPTDHDEMCWPMKKPLVGKGHPFVVRFPSVERLVQVLQRQLPMPNIEFSLLPVNIERIVFINTRYPECLEDCLLAMDPVMKEKLDKEAQETKCLKKIEKLADQPKNDSEVEVDDLDDQSLPVQQPQPSEEEHDQKTNGNDVPKVASRRKKPLIDKPRVESITYFNLVVPDRIGIMIAETHQDDSEFDRCFALKDFCMSLGALVHLREHKSKYWTIRILTNILRLGFRICIESLMAIEPQRDLKINQIIKKIELNEKFFTPVIEEYGAIGKLNSTDEAILDLLPALREVFSENDTIVVNGPLVVALWKEDGVYYMYDSHERDSNGLAILKEKNTDHPSGAACLTWYKDLRDLVDVYMANVERFHRNDGFKIATVEVKDWIQLPENWFNFKALERDRWILQGSYGQGDFKFSRDSRNTQCTANCAMALAQAHLLKLPEWSRETIDKVLENGDRYYKSCIENLTKKKKFKSPMLLVAELQQDFEVENKLISLEIAECLVNGVIAFPETYRDAKNLKTGFREFFRDNDFGILTCRGIAVSIWKFADNYFYFDSHDRDNEGFNKIHGKACVQRFLTTDKMAEVIMANFDADVEMAIYNITKVTIQVFDKVPVDAEPDEDDSMPKAIDEEESSGTLIDKLNIERPLFNFVKLTKKRAILRSRFSQFDKKEFDVNAGKQTIPNLLVATAMSRGFDPEKWTVDQVDDVLRTGNRVFDKSIEELYVQRAKDNGENLEEESNDDITIDNVVKSFKIGVNKFSVGFEELGNGFLTDANGTPLLEAIKGFFKEDPKDGDDFKELIVQTKYLEVIIWRKGSLYFLFDPKGRDDRGNIFGKSTWSEIPQEENYEDLFGGEEINEFAEGEDEEEEGVTSAANYSAYQSDPETNQSAADEWDDLEEEQETAAVATAVGAAGEEVEKMTEEQWNRIAERNGRACIMWFTKPKYLVKHLVENCPPMMREECEFKLTKVLLKNTPELKEVYMPEMGPKPDDLAGNWNDWTEITFGQWILRGSMNQKNLIFPENNRGLQCHANCLLALTYAHIYALSQFKKVTIDDILKYGDRLYTSTRRVRRRELEAMTDLNFTPEEVDEILSREKYSCDDLLKKFYIGNESVSVKITNCLIGGEVHAQDVTQQYDILRGVAEFFAKPGNRLGILTAKGYTVGIFKMGQFYYMFDPNERGPHGHFVENGVACCSRFAKLEPLAELYLRNLPKPGKNFYCIHEVNVFSEVCTKNVREVIARVEDPLRITGFQTVLPGKLILRGTISQEDGIFGKGPNAQSAAVAFVALTMNLLHHVNYWSKLIIDDIVSVGDAIYSKYLERCDVVFNPWEEKLTVEVCPKDFRIGKNRVNCELRATEQHGIINIREPNVLNLRQGLERFFEENTYGVIETELLTVAVWIAEDEDNTNFFYMFDPNPRGAAGMPLEEIGVACLIKCASSKILTDHIVSLVGSNACGCFRITPVEIVVERDGKRKKTKRYGMAGKLQKVEENAKLKCLGRLEFYEVPNEDLAVLRGTKSQNHKCFSANSRGKQDVANCIIAYVMDKLIPLQRWTHKTIDSVLDIGDQFYKDSYMVYNPKDSEKLGLETLIRDVVVRDIRVKISIGAPVLTARFNRALLREALTACFNLKTYCIVLLDRWAVAIFKKCDCFFLFDPTDLDVNGKRVDCGSAALLRFQDVDTLIEVFIRNMDARPIENDVFNIIIAAVKQIERIKVGGGFAGGSQQGLALEPSRNADGDCDKIIFGHLKH